MVGADGVGVEEAEHLVGVGVGHGLAPAGDAGVVHEDVEATELADDLRPPSPGRPRDRRRRRRRRSPPAQRLDLLHHRCCVVGRCGGSSRPRRRRPRRGPGRWRPRSPAHLRSPAAIRPSRPLASAIVSNRPTSGCRWARVTKGGGLAVPPAPSVVPRCLRGAGCPGALGAVGGRDRDDEVGRPRPLGHGEGGGGRIHHRWRHVPHHGDERVRLIGIDTPEVEPGRCFATEATAALADLIPPGTEVLTGHRCRGHDRFGRLLAYVERATRRPVRQPGAGQRRLRRPADDPAERRQADELGAAVAEAREAGRGPWRRPHPTHRRRRLRPPPPSSPPHGAPAGRAPGRPPLLPGRVRPPAPPRTSTARVLATGGSRWWRRPPRLRRRPRRHRLRALTSAGP